MVKFMAVKFMAVRFMALAFMAELPPSRNIPGAQEQATTHKFMFDIFKEDQEKSTRFPRLAPQGHAAAQPETRAPHRGEAG